MTGDIERAWGGDDQIHAGGGTNLLLGGTGDDLLDARRLHPP